MKWKTASEIDNAGINLYRAEDGGEYELIFDGLLPTEGSPTEGAAYEFVDDDVENRVSTRTCLKTLMSTVMRFSTGR
ncbi:hypothetical protein ACFL43_03535 [Thermodesulfobacteriota bacterium]